MKTIPGYWMNETSGVLAPIVRKFLEGHELVIGELAIMRAYLAQWMEGDFKGPGADKLRADVPNIYTTADLRRWLGRAIDVGIDPL